MRLEKQSGFTFTELAIIIFIIAIVVSAVLVGQTLLGASKLRSQIIQIEEYRRAINAFEAKYNALPGDFRNAISYNLGNNGNGNRVMGDFANETDLIWEHLGNAGFIDYDSSLGTLPNAKIGFGFVAIYFNSTEQRSYFHIGNVANLNSNSLTPLQAYQIDLKIDEGGPFNGDTLAAAASTADGGYGLAASIGAGGIDQNVCLDNSVSPTDYNHPNDTVLCSLDIAVGR